MAERKQTAQAANLQTKKRNGKIDKAHTITGIERSAFESAWNSLPAGVRKKCTAAELAQLVQILAQNPVGNPVKSVKRETNAVSVLHRAKIALVSAPEALRRELSRRPALPPVRDYVARLRASLTAWAVRLPWGNR